MASEKGDVGEVIGLAYNLYFMVDHNCWVEQWIYDLSTFCFTHDCGGQQLLKNWMDEVFKVTGAINALAAVAYDMTEEPPSEEHHIAWFDMYSEIGSATGKLFRYLINFDPSEEREPY